VTSPFTDTELAGRAWRLRATMPTLGADVVLATSYPNGYYLSGAPIHPFGRPFVTVLPLEADPAMVVSIIEIEHVRAQSWITDVRTYWDFNPTPTFDAPKPPPASLVILLREILADRRLSAGRLGYEDATLPMRALESLRAALPGATFVPISDALDRQRLVLSGPELTILRAADAICDLGQEAILEAVRPSVSARELHERARQVMVDAILARHPSWPFAVRIDVGLGSTARAAGHCEWTTWSDDAVVVPGQVLVAVVDCILWGYQGNVERTIVIGEPSAEVRRDFETMIEANERAIALVRPGVTFGDVDRACKEVLTRAGHSTRTGSGVARGIVSYEGNHRQLAGDVRLYNDIALEPGMAFSIEPDLQTDAGTYRHCNTIVVTESGSEVHSRLRRDLIWVPA
jgi:Xaa-Pro aminopeptidase